MSTWLRSLVSVIALQHIRREAGSTGGVCEVCVYIYVTWKVSCVWGWVCGELCECEVEGIMYVVSLHLVTNTLVFTIEFINS